MKISLVDVFMGVQKCHLLYVKFYLHQLASEQRCHLLVGHASIEELVLGYLAILVRIHLGEGGECHVGLVQACFPVVV